MNEIISKQIGLETKVMRLAPSLAASSTMDLWCSQILCEVHNPLWS